MLDFRLRKTEKNEILRLIQEAELNPAEFAWSEEKSTECMGIESVQFKISVLTHQPTSYYCKFGGYSVRFSPGVKSMEDAERHRDSWGEKKGCAIRWLVELADEIKAPDLWASVLQAASLPKAAMSASADNGSFTPQERSLIGDRLEEIREFLLDGQEATAERIASVEEQINYLKESSNRLGRKDWLNAFLGNLVGQAMALALNPPKVQGLMALVGSTFQFLWGAAQGLLQ